MRLSRALKQKELDLRLRDKLVAEGKLSKNDVDKFLNDLSDDSSNMTAASVEKEEETPIEDDSQPIIG